MLTDKSHFFSIKFLHCYKHRVSLAALLLTRKLIDAFRLDRCCGDGDQNIETEEAEMMETRPDAAIKNANRVTLTIVGGTPFNPKDMSCIVVQILWMFNVVN